MREIFMNKVQEYADFCLKNGEGIVDEKILNDFAVWVRDSLNEDLEKVFKKCSGKVDDGFRRVLQYEIFLLEEAKRKEDYELVIDLLYLLSRKIENGYRRLCCTT